jgi:hypothetical protein
MAQNISQVLSPNMDLTAYKGSGNSLTRRIINVSPSNLSVMTSSDSITDIWFDLASDKALIDGENSYLTFDLQVKCTFGTQPDLAVSNGTALSLIRAIEVVIGGQSVEYINNVNAYCALLDDLQSKTRKTNLANCLTGAGVDINNPKLGRTLNGATGVYGTKVRVSLPIPSSIIGSFQNQFGFACDGIRVRLSMAPTNEALTKKTEAGDPTAISYKLENIALKMCYLKMTDNFYSQIAREADGVLKQHANSVYDYQTTLQQSSANSILIPARYSSVNNLITMFRPLTSLLNMTGNRIQPYIKNYNISIDGTNVYPTDVIVDGTAGEVLSEFLSCFNGVNNQGFEAVFNESQYLSNDASPAQQNCFVLGCDFTEKSASDLVVGGKSTQSSNVYLNMTSTQDAPPSIVDTFVNYSMILSYDLMSGVVSVSK